MFLPNCVSYVNPSANNIGILFQPNIFSYMKTGSLEPNIFSEIRDKYLVSIDTDNLSLKKKIGLDFTKKISSILAGADDTGHRVLHTNSVIIHKILESDYLDFTTKKELTLLCIKFAQFGDHTGSTILEFFHNFVDKHL